MILDIQNVLNFYFKNVTFGLIIIGWIIWYSCPFFTDELANNIREIQTWNLDSTIMLQTVMDALHARHFEVKFYDYGHLFFNLCIGLAWGIGYLNEHDLFALMRAVSITAGGLTIGLIFAFAYRWIGLLEAWFAVVLAAFTPALLEWSAEVKPDALQLLFIVTSLYCCARTIEPEAYQLRWLMAASAAAGAAFSTKFLGIILLPLITIAAIANKPKIDAIIGRFVIIGAVFAIIFVVTSPFEVKEWHFISAISERNTIWTNETAIGLGWFLFLAQPIYVGPLVLPLAIIGAAATIIGWRNRGTWPFLFVIGFAVIFITILITRVNRTTILYGLPIVPIFILLASYGLSIIKRQFAQWRVEIAAIVLMIVVGVSQIVDGYWRMLQYSNMVTKLNPSNEALGDWLTQCVPPSTSIMIGSYGYVPPQFTKVVMSDGYDIMMRDNSEIVILSTQIINELTNKQPISYMETDRMRLHSVVKTWNKGPDFEKFQVFTQSASIAKC